MHRVHMNKCRTHCFFCRLYLLTLPHLWLYWYYLLLIRIKRNYIWNGLQTAMLFFLFKLKVVRVRYYATWSTKIFEELNDDKSVYNAENGYSSNAQMGIVRLNDTTRVVPLLYPIIRCNPGETIPAGTGMVSPGL